MTVSPQAEKQLREYFADTTRLGNNINQLTREINSDIKTIGQSSDDLNYLLGQVKPILGDIRSLLISLVRQTRV